jgi:site-specific DNA recombinase
MLDTLHSPLRTPASPLDSDVNPSNNSRTAKVKGTKPSADESPHCCHGFKTSSNERVTATPSTGEVDSFCEAAVVADAVSKPAEASVIAGERVNPTPSHSTWESPMSRSSNKALVPRNGHTLVVGIGARISGCANQNELSLDDQVDHGKEVLAEYWDGPVEYRVIATVGKGEALDRPELLQIEAEYRKEELDVFLWEDLGRLVRGADAARLLGIGVDHGVRTLVPNDCIDTADENWEQDALEACAAHVGHNAHTSKRIKKRLMNRFRKFGGVPGRPIYGYIVPKDVKTYDGWLKDPAATAVIQEGAHRLMATDRPNCSAVADGWNAEGIPVGPYSRNEKWDGKMVRRFYRNTLLKGRPERGNRCTVKNHEKGRRVSVKNPNGPCSWSCPHLAHLDPATFDALNAHLRDCNANLGRKLINGVDPRYHVSRKRTRFPGQWGRCWYCGRHHVWGGNGITGNLMCSGSREWLCWNSVGYDGALAVQKVRDLITAQLYQLDGFDDQFRGLVAAAARGAAGDSAQRWEQLKKGEVALARAQGNVTASIAEYGPMPFIKQKLAEIDATGRALARERHELEAFEKRALDLPDSTAALRTELESALATLAVDTPEFGDLLRKLVPSFLVYLVRLCDGGHLLPRARVVLALDGIVPDAKRVLGLSLLLSRTRTIDLFIPPQRERIREQAIRLAAQGLGPKEIARRIAEEATGPNAEKPTATAVQNALALDRKMRELGLDSPYVQVLSPPPDYKKLRRHKNGKYRFTPLEGYTPPLI